MKKSDWLIMLDAGHGNDTKGKESPIWEDSTQLKEGIWTRQMTPIIAQKLKLLGLSSMELVPETHDIDLGTRCARANKITQARPNSLLVSIHGNAHGVEKANGFEVFSSPGITQSDSLAESILIYAADTKKFRMRYDMTHPNLNKEARFKILIGTTGIAVLVEAGFYTNYAECQYMLSPLGMNMIGNIIALGVNGFVDSLIIAHRQNKVL